MKTILFHELKQNVRSLAIWALAIGVLMMLCMIIFPEMEKQADEINSAFASMGAFTTAFSMDKVSIADPLGYYGTQGGVVLGLGGALFAALLGAGMLSKEENEHTAEFLLAHPVSRASVISAKLLALIMLILVFNLVALALGFASFALIDKGIEGEGFWLFHLAQTALHLEVACICFGVSAFLKRASAGLGLGLVLVLYFMNLMANLSPNTEFLGYITPFAYADAGKILYDLSINTEFLVCGAAFMFVGVIVAYVVYTKKDITA